MIAGPFFRSNADPVFPAVCHFIWCGIGNRHHCSDPWRAFQTDIHPGDHAAENIYHKVHDRPSNDIGAVKLWYQINIPDCGIYLILWARSHLPIIRLPEDAAAGQFVFRIPFAFLYLSSQIPVFLIPVAELPDGWHFPWWQEMPVFCIPIIFYRHRIAVGKHFLIGCLEGQFLPC